MAQLAVPGPFGEAELTDKTGLDPGHVPFRRAIDERASRRDVPVHSPAEGLEKIVVVAGADFTGVAQPAVVFALVIVITDQEGAEPLALAFRLGVAGDDQFLTVLAFELQPVA